MNDYVLYFKAMADETRLNIVRMLMKENLCACHILEAFSITQPTLSYHMKILVDSGIVDSAKDGTWMRYSLNHQAIHSLASMFINLDSELISDRRKI